VPVACGEGITEFSLRKINMDRGEWILNKLKGYRIIVPNGNSLRIDENMAIISRKLFEKELYEVALSEGAEFLLGNELIKIKNRDGYYELISRKKTLVLDLLSERTDLCL